jgi:hypothetical protein
MVGELMLTFTNILPSFISLLSYTNVVKVYCKGKHNLMSDNAVHAAQTSHGHPLPL